MHGDDPCLDVDGNDVLSSRELSELMRMLVTLGDPLEPDEADDLFLELDADGDGRITKKEFFKLLDV